MSDRQAFPWVFAGVLVVVALNLRAPFVAVAPVTGELRSELGVSGGAIGLLTSLPVLCFGLLAPLALAVVRRAGPELAVVVCLGAVVLGSFVRSTDGYAAVVAGTVVIGLGLTVGNIVVPVLIRRESPPRVAGVVTGTYVSAMNVGSMVVLLATAPLADAIGWRTALLAWSAFALAGLAAWGLFARRTAPGRVAAPPPEESGADVHPARTPLAWLLALAFAGQATSYYALTAWLPSLLGDEIGLDRSSAGAASSVFQVSAIAGAILVPALALRWPSWAAIGIVGVLWVAFPLQLLLAPSAYLVGSVVGGVAQGGGFAALFTVVVQVSRTDRESARLSAFVQGVGYVVAALGPTALGVAHDATDDWTLPVLVVLGTTLAFGVLGVLAGLQQTRSHPLSA